MPCTEYNILIKKINEKIKENEQRPTDGFYQESHWYKDSVRKLLKSLLENDKK